MKKNILIFLLCLVFSSCTGFTSGYGLKLNNGDKLFKLKNDIFISFDKPIGNCGGGIIFAGIILPVIPVWLKLNNCDNNFEIYLNDSISVTKLKGLVKIKLKYGGSTYEPTSKEDLRIFNSKISKNNSRYGTKFKFKIDNLKDFYKSNDKAIIIIEEINGKESFSEEVPVNWSIMIYDKWSIPGV